MLVFVKKGDLCVYISKSSRQEIKFSILKSLLLPVKYAIINDSKTFKTRRSFMREDMKKHYLEILKDELVPAMGCTEPISVAYASALARKVLGELPTSVELTVSANIIKNVKSVVVPNTGGLCGIGAAAAAGIVAGSADAELEVLCGADESKKQENKKQDSKKKTGPEQNLKPAHKKRG